MIGAHPDMINADAYLRNFIQTYKFNGVRENGVKTLNHNPTYIIRAYPTHQFDECRLSDEYIENKCHFLERYLEYSGSDSKLLKDRGMRLRLRQELGIVGPPDEIVLTEMKGSSYIKIEGQASIEKYLGLEEGELYKQYRNVVYCYSVYRKVLTCGAYIDRVVQPSKSKSKGLDFITYCFNTQEDYDNFKLNVGPSLSYLDSKLDCYIEAGPDFKDEDEDCEYSDYRE